MSKIFHRTIRLKASRGESDVLVRFSLFYCCCSVGMNTGSLGSSKKLREDFSQVHLNKDTVCVTLCIRVSLSKF